MPPGAAVLAEDLGLLVHGFAQPAQQHGAAVEADQRIDLADLEGVAEPVGHQRAQAGRVGLQRRGRGRWRTGRAVKAWKLATPRPSERVKRLPVAGSM